MTSLDRWERHDTDNRQLEKLVNKLSLHRPLKRCRSLAAVPVTANEAEGMSLKLLLRFYLGILAVLSLQAAENIARGSKIHRFLSKSAFSSLLPIYFQSYRKQRWMFTGI